MERKLIANYLVPDDEVWVSPATWERPFSLKAKESTATDTQQLKAEISAQLEKLFATKEDYEWDEALSLFLSEMQKLSAV